MAAAGFRRTTKSGRLMAGVLQQLADRALRAATRRMSQAARSCRSLAAFNETLCRSASRQRSSAVPPPGKVAAQQGSSACAAIVLFDHVSRRIAHFAFAAARRNKPLPRRRCSRPIRARSTTCCRSSSLLHESALSKRLDSRARPLPRPQTPAMMPKRLRSTQASSHSRPAARALRQSQGYARPDCPQAPARR